MEEIAPEAYPPAPMPSHPVRPDSSAVTYLPNGALGRFLFPLILLLVAALAAWAGLVALRTVSLRCDRGKGTCSIVSSWGPMTSSRDVPIATLRGARRDGGSVVLVTGNGDVQLSNWSSSQRDARAAVKARIDRFLTDRTQKTLDIDYDEPQRGGFVVLGFALVVLVAAWVATMVARVEVDAKRRVLTLVTVRWPLPPKRRELDLDDVRDAIVVEGRGTKGGATYGVALVVEYLPEPVPLLGFRSSGVESKERAVAEIRALLRSRSPAASARPGQPG